MCLLVLSHLHKCSERLSGQPHCRDESWGSGMFGEELRSLCPALRHTASTMPPCGPSFACVPQHLCGAVRSAAADMFTLEYLHIHGKWMLLKEAEAGVRKSVTSPRKKRHVLMLRTCHWVMCAGHHSRTQGGQAELLGLLGESVWMESWRRWPNPLDDFPSQPVPVWLRTWMEWSPNLLYWLWHTEAEMEGLGDTEVFLSFTS